MFISSILFVHAVSIDCFNTIQLAHDLGIPSCQPTIWTQLQLDCCTASGITCVSDAVSQIDWPYMGLNGSINVISNNLTYLNLYGNQITGVIPPVWPSTLEFLYLGVNLLTGSIPDTFPNALVNLNLADNQLNGGIPLTLPNNLIFLFLHRNILTGHIPMILPSSLVWLFTYENQLFGELQIFSLTLQFIHLGYPGTNGNHFTGTLYLNKPFEFLINDNWITDVVIRDMSLISRCDLSNNPLLGNPNIVNLTICTQSGLYNASRLAFTITRDSLTSTTQTISITQTKHSQIEMASILTNSGVFKPTWTSLARPGYSFKELAHVLTIQEMIKKILKLFVNAILVLAFIRNTPWKREWKFKLSKWNGKTKPGNLLLSA